MPRLTQQDWRTDVNPMDQFGRLYLASIEKDTMDVTGGIDKCFDDPLNTPMKYLKLERKRGKPVWDSLLVQGKEWIADTVAGEKEWKANLWRIGREMHKQAFKPKEAEQDEYLLSLTGPKPFPSSDALKVAFGKPCAAQRQLLGLDPMGREGRALLGKESLEDMETAHAEERRGIPHEPPASERIADTWPSFLAARRKEGKSFKEAGELWRSAKGA